MTLPQIKQQLKGVEIQSLLFEGVVLFDGLNWLCNNYQIHPSKASIKQLYSEYLSAQHSYLGDFQQGFFYQL